jgi:hypothetical protein
VKVARAERPLAGCKKCYPQPRRGGWSAAVAG